MADFCKTKSLIYRTTGFSEAALCNVKWVSVSLQAILYATFQDLSKDRS
ncbi:hypothetical protein RO3G_01366 [Rhizopus delemar RA 99-880]|uniref:Uncharacterized protein n=1 Tax=Rhizopus delemar (strain RA 99-880 / ATCC MYA-4621 / FGSC 9543 / NRRL 43880) TaxID=246409 RepID=I1BKD2_RHIO9|nr:hypothetical protein RO3G_01366 [Rhizopus delemar RA 99-880]|eukprot:EIE76662.1 hypothetical protein RO3G_01366 [Rhizopus delemar RA 99-880]